MAHCGAQRGDEGGVAAGAQAAGREGRQPPDLPAGGEAVGRRAQRHAAREGLRVGPDIGAVRAHAHREVEIEAERHPRLARAGLRLPDLAVGEPLQPEVEGDLVRALGGEGAGGGRVGAREGGWPEAPVRAVAQRQRLEQRESRQIGPAVGAPAGEVCGIGLAHPVPERAQHGRRHRVARVAPGHLACAGGGEAGLRLCEIAPRVGAGGEARGAVGRDMGWVERDAAGGGIGADPLMRRAAGVDGVDPDEIGAEGGEALRSRAEVVIVAGTEAACGGQAPERRRRPPDARTARALGDRGRAAGGGDDKGLGALGGQAVQAGGQVQERAGPAALFDAAVLARQGPGDVAAQWDADRSPRFDDDLGRQRGGRQRLGLRQRLGDLGGRRGGHAHRPEQRGLGVGAGAVLGPVHVVPDRGHAVEFGEAGEGVAHAVVPRLAAAARGTGAAREGVAAARARVTRLLRR